MKEIINDNSLVNEIEEVEEEENFYHSTSDLFEIDNQGGEVEGSLFSFDFHNHGENDVVYVVVCNKNVSQEESSKDALFWTLNHAVINPSSTIVFLIHIFPQTNFIPTPLGMIPIGQVNEEQKENYMTQERSKRRQFLQKFVDICSASKVKVDTILIESDMEAKAILNLTPICNIRKLILGTSKANLKKMRSKRGNGTMDEILQNAPEFCEVKIICEGKEVVELQMFESPSLRYSGGSPKSTEGQMKNLSQEVQNESIGCGGCFGVKVMS
ncbi:U-box domain-containing protein 36-like [Lycium barbarum]|uniref:U-box domain-containing protein 36-like n=1 Tax=Lycium barbarum TaxID=112863 RepID=UPI00293EAA0A|nr:U-box domain-containing protein 36-like [Lycium barbarum]